MRPLHPNNFDGVETRKVGGKWETFDAITTPLLFSKVVSSSRNKSRAGEEEDHRYLPAES